jgi:hypothetical protein
VGTSTGGGGGETRRAGGSGTAPTSRELLALEQAAGSCGEGSSSGSTGARGLPAGGDADDHPGALGAGSVQRVQAAAMGCLEVLCADAGSAAALQSLVWQVAVAAVRHLGDAEPPVLREAAGRLLLAAGRVDADAVWLLLADLAVSCPAVAAADVGPPVPASPAAARLGILPLPRLLGGSRGGGGGGGGGGVGVTPQLAAACGRRAAALLAQVDRQAPRWHQQAAVPSTQPGL